VRGREPAELRRFAAALRAATSALATARPSAPAPSAARGFVLSAGQGGRMRLFHVPAAEWERRFAAVGTLAVDPRIWGAIAVLYALALFGVTTVKRAGRRRAALTELCLKSTKEPQDGAYS